MRATFGGFTKSTGRMDIKGMIADQMGAFTTHDIGGALLSVMVAALIAFIAGLLAGDRSGARGLAVLAALVAFAVVLVRGSVPLAIALVAVALVLAPRGGREEGFGRSSLLRLMAAVAGLGCGAGGALLAALLVLPVSFLLRWAFPSEK